MSFAPWLLLVMVLTSVGKHHRKLSFALLSQTVQLMLVPSYMGASMLLAHPVLALLLTICLGALYVYTRALARLLTRWFATESCTSVDKGAWKRNRQTRKKLAKTRRAYIFEYGARRLLLKEAGFKLSGFNWWPSGLALVS